MTDRELPNRREVIVGAAATLLGAAALSGCRHGGTGADGSVDAGVVDGGPVDAGVEDASTGVDARGRLDAADFRDAEPAPDAGDMQCEPTVAQSEGPFGQAGLERSNLAIYGHAGVPFRLSGRVLDRECRPVAGAQVLLWHASPSPPGMMPRTLTEDAEYTAAVYDHALEASAVTPDGQTVPTADQQYYGWTTAGAQGVYRFESLRPGWYLNGSTYRASHLHVQVRLTGRLRLTSQIYFPDDPFNERDGIYTACTPLGSCTMQIDPQGEARYDLVIED